MGGEVESDADFRRWIEEQRRNERHQEAQEPICVLKSAAQESMRVLRFSRRIYTDLLLFVVIVQLNREGVCLWSESYTAQIWNAWEVCKPADHHDVAQTTVRCVGQIQ